MEFIPDKPYKTIDEQIVILKQRGLKFDNYHLATKILNDVGYYNLINGYSKPFETDGKYEDGVFIEHIYFQYIIDENLKKTLLNSMLIIENKLRNNLAEVISSNYGVYDKTENDYGVIPDVRSYLSKSNYQNETLTSRTMQDLKKTRNKCKTNPTMYYRDNKNHIPPWILLKNVSFWNINSLYKILKNPLKDEVTSYFYRINMIENTELRKQTFYEIMEIIRTFRNSSAHSNLFYSKKSNRSIQFKVIESIFGPGVVSAVEYNKQYLGKNDLFALMISLIIVTPDPFSLQQDFNKLNTHLEEYNGEYLGRNPYEDFLNFSNLPRDWHERISSAIKYATQRALF